MLVIIEEPEVGFCSTAHQPFPRTSKMLLRTICENQNKEEKVSSELKHTRRGPHGRRLPRLFAMLNVVCGSPPWACLGKIKYCADWFYATRRTRPNFSQRYALRPKKTQDRCAPFIYGTQPVCGISQLCEQISQMSNSADLHPFIAPCRFL